MDDIRVGLCIDPVGSKEQVARLCQLLKRHRIHATVTPAGTVAQKTISTIDHLRPFLEGGHEIANHTQSHPVRIGQLEKEEQEKEITLQHRRLIELGHEFGTPFAIKGFRAPFYAFESSVFEMLRSLDYRWDSSALYSPLLGVPFRPFMQNEILEIPVLFPDDMTLLDRMLLTPEEVFQTWWRCYEKTGRYFVFTVHPYGSAKDEQVLAAFENFLTQIEKEGGRFLTLSEIAEEVSKEI
jgi:peptidoglycan/xylan/chitin deacetylase (PgdA/CDA1 family)